MLLKKIIITIIALSILGFIYIQFINDKQPRQVTKAEAIQQAQSYKPDGLCTQANVPAVHEETGAKYTFNSGCLAPGWVPER